MSFSEYNPTVMDHFLNPRNTGELKNPSCSALEENPACGDQVKLTLNVRGGIISEARTKTFGCAAAIAASSALTEMLVGKSIEEASKIKDSDVVDRLGGLPEHKIKCSMVVEQVVRGAVEDYRKKEARTAP